MPIGWLEELSFEGTESTLLGVIFRSRMFDKHVLLLSYSMA